MKKLLFFVFILGALSCNQNKGEAIVSDADTRTYTTLDSLSDIIINDPNNSNSYYQRALFFHSENESDQALADIKRALSIDSTIADYYSEAADIFFENNAIDEAFAAYQKAVEFDNRHVHAIIRLSQIELALENYDLAFEMVNKALKIDPMNPEGYYWKGFIFLDKGDTARAISSYRTAIEVDPDHYDSYIMLGKLYATKGHAFAGDYYDNAIRIRPKSIEARYDKGVYLQEIGEYEEAYSLYDEIIALDSASYFAYYNRGYMMLITDSTYSGAIDEFEKSLLYYPYYFQALYNIGLCYENLGEYKKAEEYYKKSLDINPQYDLAAKGLSRLLE